MPDRAEPRLFEIGIAPGQAGERLDRALQHHLPELSRTRVKQLILDGAVRSRDVAVRDPSRRRWPAATSSRSRSPPPRSRSRSAQAIPLDIRFEDAHLIVLDKPAGMVVHPAPGNPDGTLVNALLAHCGPSLAGIGGVKPPGNRPSPRQGHQRPDCRRQDRPRASRPVARFRRASHRARYVAFVWGVPLPLRARSPGNIGRSTANRKKMAVVAEGRGKPAVTRYRVERTFAGSAARLECRLVPAAPIKSGYIWPRTDIR